MAVGDQAMPATRSRTENWRRSLQQLFERNGALEIALPGNEEPALEGASDSLDSKPTAHLIWRVRVLDLNETEIIVEQPAALGQFIRINTGSDLIAVIVIGQNRWMFRTVNLGLTDIPGRTGRSVKGLRLQMPTDVERCQRRNFYRVGTVELNLPSVECYPVLDVSTIAVAEIANRTLIQELGDALISGRSVEIPQSPTMPEVGPKFNSLLLNVGGGGVGLLVNPDDRGKIGSERLFWLKINLQPEIPVPLGIAARLKHTHIDSSQRTYAGMAFEFGFDPMHQKFILDQLCRYAADVQRIRSTK